MANKVKLSYIHEEGYGTIAKKVMKDRDLDIEAKGIYSYLCSYAGTGNTCYPSVSLMCDHLNISENRFYKYRKQLTEKNYIAIEKHRQDGKRDNNIYHINLNPHLQNEGIENEGIEFEGKENEGTINNSSINNSSINNNIPTLSNLERTEGGNRKYPDKFEEIWNEYPNRKGSNNKGGGYKKYRARINEGINHQALIEAVEKYYTSAENEDIIDTPYVMQMSKFFGEKDIWLEYKDKDITDNCKDIPASINDDEVAEYLAEMEC